MPEHVRWLVQQGVGPPSLHMLAMFGNPTEAEAWQARMNHRNCTRAALDAAGYRARRFRVTITEVQDGD